MKILNMRTILTSLLFILIYSNSHSQNKYSSLLQACKYRTPGFNAFTIEGYSNGNLNKATGNSASSGFTFYPQASLFSTFSTDKKLAVSSINFRPGLFISNSKINGQKLKNTFFTLNLSESINIKTFNSGNKYFEKGVTAIADFSDNKLNQSQTNTTVSRRYLGNIQFLIGMGKGRVENVTDMQMALRIVEALEKNNLLNGPVDNYKITELAKTITYVNNRRIFDFRRKRIFELKQIDSTLQANNIISDKGIHYFTTVADNWVYNYNPLRRHGRERYIRLAPFLNTDYNKFIIKKNPSDSVNSFSFSNTGATLFLGIEKNNAKNLEHQFNKGLQLITTFARQTRKPANNNIDNNFFNTGLRGLLQWGYFPNTRTSFNASVNNTFSYTFSHEEFGNVADLQLEFYKTINYNTSIGLSAFARQSTNFAFNSYTFNSTSLNFLFTIQHNIR